MFIKTVKVKKPKILAAVLLGLILCAAAVLVIMSVRLSKSSVRELASETQRQEFLKEMGWQVSDQANDMRNVTIPEEWNDVYKNYNKLQQQQGFDLTGFKGKQATVYTYIVTNYPGHEGEECVLCNLLVCDGKLIGGDVCSTALDGFMQGLRAS